jgi:(S)-ureidoglycine aminohydrolase
MQPLGLTRSANRRDHLLQTPDTFVRAPLPGMTRGTAIVHAAPALGAGFTQYTAELEAGGTLGPTPVQRFVYVIQGATELSIAKRKWKLKPGGYAFLPTGCAHFLKATKPSVLAVIEKPYAAIEGVDAPEPLVRHESEIATAPLGGDPDLQVAALLPDDPALDFAVNTMTYQPGAALSMVEIHVMEHGLLMLEGGGIYRLGDDWYPVRAGDFIWMAPYCPQWFGALGKAPAKYLIYKDWNRHPLG